MFIDHTVLHEIWSLKVSKTTNVIINWVSYRPPTARFCFITPLVFLTPPRGGAAHFGNNCSTQCCVIYWPCEPLFCRKKWYTSAWFTCKLHCHLHNSCSSLSVSSLNSSWCIACPSSVFRKWMHNVVHVIQRLCTCTSFQKLLLLQCKKGMSVSTDIVNRYVMT